MFNLYAIIPILFLSIFYSTFFHSFFSFLFSRLLFLSYERIKCWGWGTGFSPLPRSCFSSIFSLFYFLLSWCWQFISAFELFSIRACTDNYSLLSRPIVLFDILLLQQLPNFFTIVIHSIPLQHSLQLILFQSLKFFPHLSSFPIFSLGRPRDEPLYIILLLDPHLNLIHAGPSVSVPIFTICPSYLILIWAHQVTAIQTSAPLNM